MLIELFRVADQIELANGAQATFVRLDGKQKSSGMGMGSPVRFMVLDSVSALRDMVDEVLRENAGVDGVQSVLLTNFVMQ